MTSVFKWMLYYVKDVNFVLVEHYKEAPLASSGRFLCYCVSLFFVNCSRQMKGLNFPGSHDPRFCQFVIDRSRHLLKPVRVFCWLVWNISLFLLRRICMNSNFLWEYIWIKLKLNRSVIKSDTSPHCNLLSDALSIRKLSF